MTDEPLGIVTVQADLPQGAGNLPRFASIAEHGKLQRDLNDMGVRSFILTGAPVNQ